NLLAARDRLPRTRGGAPLEGDLISLRGPVVSAGRKPDDRLRRVKLCGRQWSLPSVTDHQGLALVVASNLLRDERTHRLTVNEQGHRHVRQDQLLPVVHIEGTLEALGREAVDAVCGGRGNALRGIHHVVATLQDAPRKVLRVVLATNARPARPRQRTPLSGRAGQWPRRRSGEGAGSRLHVGD